MKCLFLTAILSLIFLATCEIAVAQDVLIKGRVLDSATNKPLDYATVSLLRNDSFIIKSVATDKNGEFDLRTPYDRSIVILKVEFIGYRHLTKSIERQEGQNEIVVPDIFLSPFSISMKGVTIVGQKNTASIQLNKQVIDVNKFSNTANGTGLDVVKRLPAVTVNTAGNVLLRGSENFLILINGKISNRTPSEILAQLPANSIESVELITTPSSNYDAEGKAGIINIITKKNVVKGWSFSGNGMFGGIDPLRYSGDASLSYTKEKWSTFLSADYRRYNIDGYRIGEVRTFYQDTVTFLPSDGIRPLKEKLYGIRGGTSYSANSSNSFNVGYYYGYRQNDRIANLHYKEYIQTIPPYDLYKNDWTSPSTTFYNQNLFVRTGEFFTLNTDYSHNFKNKQKLSLLGIYEYSVLGGPLRNQNNAEGTGELLLQERSDERSPLKAWRTQVDYSIPFANKSKLDFGYQWRYVHHLGYFTFERLNIPTGVWEKDPEFNDNLDLKQAIHSGYVQYSGQHKLFSYNVGLRAENMNRTFIHDQGTTPLKVKQFDLFPSIQGLWSYSNNQKVRLGYSRRIDRPTTRLMSPFKNHRHSEFIEVGDPSLLPEITDVVELSYSRSGKKINITATGYFNSIKNKIYRVNDVYSRITLLRTFTNAGNARSVGFEFTSDIKATSWLRFYFSGNTYHLHIDGLVKGVEISQNGWNYNLNGNTSVDIGKQFKFQLDANYLSKTITAQGDEGELFLANAGLRYLLNNKITAGILLQNILQSNHQTITNVGQDFYVTTNYIKYDRVLQLNLSVRLNEMLKKSRVIKTEYGEKDF